MNYRSDFVNAVGVPTIPWELTLVAGLSNAGFKVVPTSWWMQLGRKPIHRLFSLKLHNFNKIGWSCHINSIRQERHESWQYDLAEKYHGAWVIPCEELVCFAKDDPHALDLVDITRLIYTGTDVNSACKALCETLPDGL